MLEKINYYNIEIKGNTNVKNYFKNDDIHTRPCMLWSSSAALFFSNWVNYAVYQETPFDWKRVEDDVSHFGYL